MYTGKQMLPILGPHAQAGSLSNIIGREQKKGQQRHCFLPLLWAGDRALSIPHTSLASLPGYQAGSQRAVCFSCSVGTAAASAPKQGTEARACKHFGSNRVHGAGMRDLGSEPHLPEPGQVGAATTRLPFIIQHYRPGMIHPVPYFQ